MLDKNTNFSDYLCIIVISCILEICIIKEMSGKQTIWDPLRKKEVILTPEEKVRQWFITILAQQIQVPMHMMMSETGFKLGDKQFRADILVYDRTANPLMVVECKRPDVELTLEVLDQAIRYNMVLNVRYMAITNGHKTFVFQMRGQKYELMEQLHTYNEMVK